MGKLWDRLSEEGSKAYSGFVIYRDLGITRSIDAAWKQYSKTDKVVNGYFSQWAVTFQWVNRAAAYDDYIEAQARKQLEREAIQRKADMLRRHATAGRVLMQKGIQRLDQFAIDTSRDAIQAVKIGVEMERKAEGLPEWVFQIVNADDDELQRQYNTLLAQIGFDSGGDETEGDTDTGTASAEENDDTGSAD